MTRLSAEHLLCDLLSYESICTWPFGQSEGVCREGRYPSTALASGSGLAALDSQ